MEFKETDEKVRCEWCINARFDGPYWAITCDVGCRHSICDCCKSYYFREGRTVQGPKKEHVVKEEAKPTLNLPEARNEHPAPLDGFVTTPDEDLKRRIKQEVEDGADTWDKICLNMYGHKLHWKSRLAAKLKPLYNEVLAERIVSDNQENDIEEPEKKEDDDGDDLGEDDG